MQKWDSICIDGKHWKAPRRQMDLDRMNGRRRRGHRDSRFILSIVWPVRYALAIGLSWCADKLSGGRSVNHGR